MASHLELVRRLFGSSFSISRWYIPGHDGIDLPAKYGTPVYAIAAGKVSYARDSRLDPSAGKAWAEFGGNVVNIDISGRYTTQYAHLSGIAVQPGQSISRGQLIGYVGDTGGGQGGSTSGTWLVPGAHFGHAASHVHFGLWDHTTNRMINPTSFLTATATGGPTPTFAGKAADDLTGASSTFLGGWGDHVKFPTGHIITRDDVDTIMSQLQAAHYFDDPVTGAVAYDITKSTLIRVAVGKPWNKDTQVLIQNALNADAQNAGDAGGLRDIADMLGKLTDPGNWLRILALLGGIVIFGVGSYGVLKATGAPLPSRP